MKNPFEFLKNLFRASEEDTLFTPPPTAINENALEQGYVDSIDENYWEYSFSNGVMSSQSKH